VKVCPTCRLRYNDEDVACLVDGSPLARMTDPRIGAVLGGRYTLVEVLGRGGMGTVYRARHAGERLVAIKVLHDRFADDAALRERLEREARSTKQLAHPNIVEVMDFGLTETLVPYLVMELLQGEPLDQPIKRDGAFELDRALMLGLHLARGLARAHDFGVIHRDVKPENVFVCSSDDGTSVAKLMDFGIALAPGDRRLTAAGQFLGSPKYTAPERFRAREEITPASDLYALGVVLFEMVAGRLPFASESMAGWVLHHMETVPPELTSVVPGCPPVLSRLVAELLAKEPKHRPVDAHAVVSTLGSMASEKARRVRQASTISREIAVPDENARLGAWRERARLYQLMVDRVWPGVSAPPAIANDLAELTGALGRLDALRKEAQSLEAAVGAEEARQKADRQRLVHAVETLARDLSQLRSQTRLQGGAEESASEHLDRYRLQLAKLIHMDATMGSTPSPLGLETLREALAAYEAWTAAAAPSPTRDLEFQLQALRDQVERKDAESRQEQESRKEQLRASADERIQLEQRVLRLSRALGETLRPFPQNRDLFRKMRGGTMRAIG
tara:strand:- start:1516 stop:3198 length:1683 start_codon:yes stop_codon:yes gene_type:complete